MALIVAAGIVLIAMTALLAMLAPRCKTNHTESHLIYDPALKMVRYGDVTVCGPPPKRSR